MRTTREQSPGPARSSVKRLRLLVQLMVLIHLASTVVPMVRAQAGSDGGGAGITVSVVQQAAPDGTTRSLTFLSSGYTSEATFLADVETCRSTLAESATGVIADPWPRYMPMFNVYAIYERSAQAGASRPRGRLHDCTWMKRCAGPNVRNNLGCQFGTPNPQFVNCDVNRVVSLAALAPAQDLVVVLINETDPGGVATNGMVYLTSDPAFMPFMLVHYLNRAMANLHEEYNLGLSAWGADATRYVAPNCAVSNESAREKWGYWYALEESGGSAIAVGPTASAARFKYTHTGDNTHPQRGSHAERRKVLRGRATPAVVPVTLLDTAHAWPPVVGRGEGLLAPSPSIARLSAQPPPLRPSTVGRGCTFSNFVAPSEDACLMRNSSVNFMCPVCREQLSLSFFARGVSGSVLLNASAASLNLVARRCPAEGLTTYVELDAATGALATPLYLSAGAALDRNDMEVTWTLEGPGGPVVLARNTSALTLAGTALSTWTLPARVTVIVKDRNPYVRPALRDVAEASGEGFIANTTFLVDRRVAGVTTCVSPVPACFAGSPSGANTCVASALMEGIVGNRHVDGGVVGPLRSPLLRTVDSYNVTNIMGDAPEPIYNQQNIIIVASVTGGVALLLLIVLFSVYGAHVRRKPREVLNLQLLDRLLFSFLVPCCILDLAIAVLILVFTTAFIPSEFFRGVQFMIASVVLGAVVYLVAVFNLCSVLFRWYPVSMTCAVLYFILSLGFFALGVLALWAHYNQDAPGLSRTVANIWVNTLQSAGGSRYICSMQFHLSCSGFHTGCFLTNSTECPSQCGSNLFVNACQVPFLGFIGSKYLPVGILVIIGGFLFVITATLDTLYFMRFRQLSRTGRLRRAFRKDPRAPVVPITHHECDTVRMMFRLVCAQPAQTLAGKRAVRFLQDVFGERVPTEERKVIAGLGPLTFDELMTVYFPYVVSAAADPRMLTPDEAEDARDMTDLQRRQYAKLQEYATAAGTLSPEALHNIFVRYTEKRFLPRTAELLTAIREEAARDPNVAMFRGLSPMELEGLRASWVALHPRVTGALSMTEVRTFYEWCHGERLPLGDETALAKWVARLAVREAGTVGWAEFCYPYAQRALLREARAYLAAEEKEIPPEVLTREAAVAKFGRGVVEQCFLPYENEIPMERLVASLL